ncbi:MAG: AAA family ATPase [Dysgonamonadaceae bacterium]|jgi:predicted ATPase|nr:AAA family ATPase [Dysgonamonadaceae bacterium]
MIKKVIIRDFFSFRGKNEIPLNDGINIMCGINGSGKTSFLNAFKLLHEGVSGRGFERLFQEQWGGFHQIANANQEVKQIQLIYVFDYKKLKQINQSSSCQSDVSYSITINRLGTSDYTINEKIYADNEIGTPFYYLDISNGTGQIAAPFSDEPGKGWERYKYNQGELSGKELFLNQIKDPRYIHIHTIRKAIESLKIYSDFNIREIRKPQTESGNLSKLKSNGVNLAHLLNYIKNNKTLSYEKIEKNLSKINPDYKGIEVPYRGGGQLSISLREKGLDRTIEALHISDGTLRYILLMSILCNPDRGLFVGIDEPECGLHPDMIKSVCDMMKEASDSQIIIATHSPLLLNHFELEDILVFEKNEQNETKVKRYSENDFPDWEGDFLAGQMWLRGQIGGKRW